MDAILAQIEKITVFQNSKIQAVFRWISSSLLTLTSAGQLLQAIFLRRKFFIKTKYSDQPIIVRGRTSDVQAFIEVFILKIYKIPKREASTIIDVGANVGYASVFFAHHFPTARIIAVEPELSNYQMLVENTLTHQNISCMQIAVWSQETKLTLQNPLGANWSFHYQEEENPADKPMVTAQTLPGLMKQFGFKRIDLLKIDIEGGETALFASGANWLSYVDCLQIEIHSKEARKIIFNALASYPHLSVAVDAFNNHHILLNHDIPD